MLFLCKEYRLAFSGLSLALLLFLFPSFSGTCQPLTSITLKGTVVDIKTQDPVASAHVYISQTTMGTTTNERGEFRFRTKMNGEQILVISFLGYKTVAKNIQMDENEMELSFFIQMEPDQFDLEEVNISTSNKDWVDDYQKFKRYFLGENFFAQETVIENPWVIDFERDKYENLIATADQPINIKNHALGYNIEIDLVNFTLYNSEDASAYTYYSSFEEMTPKSSADAEKWKENRRIAYHGSFEHFLKSLYHEKLWANNFEVVYMSTFDPYTIEKFIETQTNDQGGNQNAIKVYRLQTPVDVLYGEIKSPFQQRQRSRITPRTELGIFTVTENGRLNNPQSLRLDGVWASHLIATLLPMGYYSRN